MLKSQPIDDDTDKASVISQPDNNENYLEIQNIDEFGLKTIISHL